MIEVQDDADTLAYEPIDTMSDADDTAPSAISLWGMGIAPNCRRIALCAVKAPLSDGFRGLWERLMRLGRDKRFERPAMRLLSLLLALKAAVVE